MSTLLTCVSTCTAPMVIIWGSSDMPHSQNKFITVKFQNITDEKKMILKAFRENPGLRIVLTAGWIVEDYDGKP